jgi:short-subunit dehydrogenase
MTLRPRALVTGASAGLGAAFAEQLAQQNYDLVLVARRFDRLQALAEKLTHVEVEVMAADLSAAEGLARVERRLVEGSPISLLINNAGFGAYRPFAELMPERAEELIALQVLAPTRLARAVLPGMVGQGEGGIINIASLLALSSTLPPKPLPFRATYAGAKSYLLTFTQALAHEIAGTGVKVQVCLPGLIATEFHTSQGLDVTKMQPMMAPADLVTASLTALSRGEPVCIPGLDDPRLFEQLGEIERTILRSANRPNLSERYRS